MTDERIDALIRRLDATTDPDPEFVRSTYASLLPRARAAHVRDTSGIGRLTRDLHLVMAGARRPSTARSAGVVGLTPIPRPTLLKSVVAATVIGVIAVGAAFFVTRPDQPAVGGPSPSPNATSSPSAPASPSAGPSAAVVAPRAAAWTATGKMTEARSGHTAILLLDRRVLVVGGGAAVAGANDYTSVELYDPGTGTWTATGSMLAPRGDGFSATLLADGKVLVAGGGVNTGTLTSSELYDPISGTWSPTGSMVAPSGGHMAVRLLDGKVLVAGGAGNTGAPASAELYDPTSGIWTATGKMVGGAAGAGATLLRDGKVLVFRVSGSSELYDPISGTWTATGTMITPTCACTATLLPDGKVLVAGDASAQLYDPQSGAWSATQDMVAARAGHAAVLLPDGKVLVAGGIGSEEPGVGTPVLASAELYDPDTGRWTSTGSMATPRDSGFSATLLADGKVLVAGGMAEVPMMGGTGGSVVASAELYDPGTGN